MKDHWETCNVLDTGRCTCPQPPKPPDWQSDNPKALTLHKVGYLVPESYFKGECWEEAEAKDPNFWETKPEPPDDLDLYEEAWE